MRRRSFFGVGVMLLMPSWASAQATAVGRIAILKELVGAIGAAGDAISKLTAGFKDLVLTGAAGYDYVAAKRQRDRLIDISRRTANLIARQNIRVVQSLDEYLGLETPTEDDWKRVVRNLESTLSSVRELLADVQAEKGEFVLEPAFLTLNKTLSARSSLLQQLAAMPAPTTAEERNILRAASAKYKVLISNAENAVKELNSYVKLKK